MAILNVGSTIRDLTGAAAVYAGATGDFDPAYSSRAVEVVHGRGDLRQHAPRLQVPFPAPVGDLWAHFRARMPTWGTQSRNDGTWLEIVDSDFRVIARINQTNSNLQAQAVAASTVSGSTWDPAPLEEADYDIRVSVTGTIQIEVYRSQGLVSSATVNNTDRGAPAFINFVHVDWTDSGAGSTSTAYSELIVTDGEPTLGWRLATMDPVAPGTYSDWQGGYAELAALETGARVSASNTTDRLSWIPDAYSGEPNPANVRAVVAKAGGAAGPLGASQLVQFLRIAGVDYEGAAQDPNLATRGNLEVWDLNPNTVVPWTVADLANMEVGLRPST